MSQKVPTEKELVSKIKDAKLSKADVADLFQEVCPAHIRFANLLATHLYQSLIPLTILWSFTPLSTMSALGGTGALRLWILGTMTMVVGACAAHLMRNLFYKQRLPDKHLLTLSEEVQFYAYHPNRVLKIVVANKGFATYGDLSVWYKQQSSILETKISDLESNLADLERIAKAEGVVVKNLSLEARAFIDS